jgi:serine/threonine protein kinase
VNTAAPSAASSDSQLVQILDRYLAALQAGTPPERNELLAKYPELAADLEACLASLEFIRQGAVDARFREAEAENPPGSGLVTGVLGDFRLLREIGRGGMGVVYEAEQVSLGRRVALKVLPFAAAMDPKQLQRFRIEAQAAAHLHHTNIVPVHAVGCERGVQFYAMQYIEGQTMAALIGELRELAGLDARDPSLAAAPASALASELLSGRWAPARRGPASDVPAGATGPCPAPTPTEAVETTTKAAAPLSTQRSTTSPTFFRTVAHLGVQAAEALEHAHAKGIIHRDIKPANLLIDASGNLWITDFGLARMLSEAGLTMTGDLLGTLRYMSPEQALAKRVSVDRRTDIYSLGVTLYELLTLRPAYDGRDRQEIMQQIAFEEPRPPRRLNKAIPAELDTIIRKTMGKNPAERYATAQELADDLRRFLDDKPIRAKRPTLLDWTRKWARRHQGVVTTGIVGLIVAVTILLVSTFLLFSAYQSEAVERRNAVEERQSAVTALYRSLLREAEAIRRARVDGYRYEVWQRLQEGRKLDTPEKELSRLRQEAVACMGDFVGLQPTTWSDFPANVNTIAPHPKASQLAIGLEDGTVLLRDLGTSGNFEKITGHSNPVSALAFAPDGTRLVSGDRGGTIHIWEAFGNGKWKMARTISAKPTLVGFVPAAALPYFIPHLDFPSVKCLAISPDGKQLGVCAGDTFSFFPSTISLWSFADGTWSVPLASGWGKHSSLAFSPDGKYLAATYFTIAGQGPQVEARPSELIPRGVLVWELKKGGLPKTFSPGLSFVEKVAFSPDSKLLACGCGSGVALFDTSNFQPHLFKKGDYSDTLAFSPDSQLLAVNGGFGEFRLWNVTTNNQLASLCNQMRLMRPALLPLP